MQNSRSTLPKQDCKPQKKTALRRYAKPSAANEPPGGGQNTEEQRSGAPNEHRQANNYRFSFCNGAKKVISGRGWRFAPACCAAQSVIWRGPGGAVPNHRLPWAALNLHRRRGLHQQNASASPMKAVHSLSSSSFSRPNGCGLTGRSTGHFAAVQVWASKA